MEGPPPSYLPTYGQLMTYMTEIYRRYADAFGTGFSVEPPYSADAYIEALTGSPRAITMSAHLDSSGHATLVAPYGMPAAALLAGSYVLTISDRSRRQGFRLAGPGVHIDTGSTFRGRKSSSVRLRKGTYTYGAGPKAGHRLVVF